MEIYTIYARIESKLFPKISFFRRELPYILSLSFLKKILQEDTISWKDLKQWDKFLIHFYKISYKGHLAESGENGEDIFINYSWGCDLREQALEIISSKLITKVLEIQEYLFVKKKKKRISICGDCEYAREQNTCPLFNKWLLRCSKISTDSKSEIFLIHTAEGLDQMKEKLKSFLRISLHLLRS